MWRKEIPFTPLAVPQAPQHSSTEPLSTTFLEQDEIFSNSETEPRRNRKVGSGPLQSTPQDGINTIFDIVERSSQKFSDTPAQGTRPLLRPRTQEQELVDVTSGSKKLKSRQKQWSSVEKGAYSWTSYKDYGKLVHQIGAGLRKLGMFKGDKLHVYAATRLVRPKKTYLYWPVLDL